jgi:hypothetical protein
MEDGQGLYNRPKMELHYFPLFHRASGICQVEPEVVLAFPNVL